MDGENKDFLNLEDTKVDVIRFSCVKRELESACYYMNEGGTADLNGSSSFTREDVPFLFYRKDDFYEKYYECYIKYE